MHVVTLAVVCDQVSDCCCMLHTFKNGLLGGQGKGGGGNMKNKN